MKEHRSIVATMPFTAMAERERRVGARVKFGPADYKVISVDEKKQTVTLARMDKPAAKEDTHAV